MIKSIRLQNFFGFQDCTINLEKGENVLVGINGSGKSNFFKAMTLLNEGLKEGGLRNLFKQWGGFDNVYYIPKLESRNNSIIFSIEYDRVLFFIGKKQEVTRSEKYVLTIKKNGLSGEIDFQEHALVVNTKTESKTIFESKTYIDTIAANILSSPSSSETKNKNIREDRLLSKNNNLVKTSLMDFPGARILFSDIKYYSSFDTSSNSKIRRPIPLSKEKLLSANGDNLPLLLYELKSNYRKDSYSKIIKSLIAVSNSYSDLHFELFSDHILLKLEEKDFNRSVSALHVSDGTLRFLCLLAILYNPNRGLVICIDEPELGLHPDMLYTLREAIKFAAQTSQIIISTHSPQLLDWFDFENIRVFEKDGNNATVVKELDKKRFEGWYDTYMLGDMWMKGDIGGRV